MRIWMFFAAACLALSAAWFFRLELVAINHGDGMGGAYLMNRWTGRVYFLRGTERMEVTPAN